MYLGDFKEDGDLFHKFTTRAFATGIPGTLTSGALSVYKDEGGAATEKTTSETYFDIDLDHDSITGFNNVRIDLSGDAFFATGADYGGTWDPAAAATSPIYTSGSTQGNIDRSALSWFRTNYKNGTDSAAANLLADMRTFWNDISANLASPNFLICDQTLYEYYEDEVSDKQQIVRTLFNRLAADLGFETLTFKGAPISWTGQLSSSSKMMFLNLDFIELVYDPTMWFDMTEWYTTPSQLERVAYIISAMQLIDTQPRRHGLLDYHADTD